MSRASSEPSSDRRSSNVSGISNMAVLQEKQQLMQLVALAREASMQPVSIRPLSGASTASPLVSSARGFRIHDIVSSDDGSVSSGPRSAATSITDSKSVIPLILSIPGSWSTAGTVL